LLEIKRINHQKFSKLTQELQNYIDQKKTGGIILLIYQKDKIVYCDKFGWKDIAKNEPLEFDTIFRIYSMTKPIVCLATLMLYEEGKFDLDDPISKFIPEFSNLKVLKSVNTETNEMITEDAKNQITIRHLFTHTSGLSYGFIPNIPIDDLYSKEFDFKGDNRGKSVLEKVPKSGSLEEFIPKLAKLPLAFEPGTFWKYGFNHDVLGYLIEKLTGKKLDIFLKERLFHKLGMVDTDFYVPEFKWHKVAKVYTRNTENELNELKGPMIDGYRQKPELLSGGGGLVSSIADYLKFTVMMLKNGELEGQKIVRNSTIDMMTQNHLTENKSLLGLYWIKPEDPDFINREEGYGFGLGVRVKVEENITKSGVGEHDWGGALNTLYWIDPLKEVVGILMTQYCPPDSDWIQPVDDVKIKNLVYEALKDSPSIRIK